MEHNRGMSGSGNRDEAIRWLEPFHRVSEACEMTGPTPGTRADIENGAIDCRGPRLDDLTIRVIR